MTDSLTERLRVLKEKDENGLLPCPFCGSSDIHICENGYDAFWAICNDCGVCTSETDISGKIECIEFWNTRIRESALLALCEEALREVEEAREYVELEQNRYQMAIRLMRERHEQEHAALKAQIEYLTRLHVDIENLHPKPIVIATQALKEASNETNL